MFGLGSILHLFIGSALSGTAIFIALIAGYQTMGAALVAALIGFVAAFPVTYLVAKALRKD